MYVEIIITYNMLLLVGLYGASVHHQRAGFSFRSIIDAALPAIQPLVNAGSSRCEALKNIFGITYEQMLAKNASFHEQINIDYVTKNGNVKYNITSIKRLKKLMEDAESIVILIHGFMESSDGMMVQAIAPEFLKQKDLKMFALDGRKIINLEYFRSSTYARFMGELLGIFLSHLIEDGLDSSKIYLIGHSLGSHIAGIAGKQVLQTTGKLLGRITGLDPAGPCFSTAGLGGRLDKADAAYVDVIHTSSGMLGLKEPVGHKDFYPNGGVSQAGCLLYICDHSRAWEFFAESISVPKGFPARKCESWTLFKEGKCSKHDMTFMGYRSTEGPDLGPGSYFLSTASSSPFSLGPAVPGSSAILGYGSGHGNGGARGAKNPQQRPGYHFRQRRLALVIHNIRNLRTDDKLIELEKEMKKSPTTVYPKNPSSRGSKAALPSQHQRGSSSNTD